MENRVDKTSDLGVIGSNLGDNSGANSSKNNSRKSRHDRSVSNGLKKLQRKICRIESSSRYIHEYLSKSKQTNEKVVKSLLSHLSEVKPVGGKIISNVQNSGIQTCSQAI